MTIPTIASPIDIVPNNQTFGGDFSFRSPMYAPSPKPITVMASQGHDFFHVRALRAWNSGVYAVTGLVLSNEEASGG